MTAPDTDSYGMHQDLVHPSGFEPLTSRLSGACSNQLSYGCGRTVNPTNDSSRKGQGKPDR